MGLKLEHDAVVEVVVVDVVVVLGGGLLQTRSIRENLFKILACQDDAIKTIKRHCLPRVTPTTFKRDANQFVIDSSALVSAL